MRESTREIRKYGVLEFIHDAQWLMHSHCTSASDVQCLQAIYIVHIGDASLSIFPPWSGKIFSCPVWIYSEKHHQYTLLPEYITPQNITNIYSCYNSTSRENSLQGMVLYLYHSLQYTCREWYYTL